MCVHLKIYYLSSDMNALHAAAREGQSEMVEHLIKKHGAAVNSLDEDGMLSFILNLQKTFRFDFYLDFKAEAFSILP